MTFGRRLDYIIRTNFMPNWLRASDKKRLSKTSQIEYNILVHKYPILIFILLYIYPISTKYIFYIHELFIALWMMKGSCKVAWVTMKGNVAKKYITCLTLQKCPILVLMLRGWLAEYLACAYHTYQLWVMNIISGFEKWLLGFQGSIGWSSLYFYTAVTAVQKPDRFKVVIMWF